MKLFKKVPINFDEKNYEIRVYYSDTLINIVSFLNNYPSTGLRHQIQLPKKCNVKGILKEAMLDELIEISKQDITQKRDERLLKIIQENIT